jgi:oxidoreductase
MPYYKSFAAAIVLVAILYGRNALRPPLKIHPRGPVDDNTLKHAIVFGGTGATGRRLVDQLIASPKWTVTSIVRRKTDRVAQEGYIEKIVPDLLQIKQNVFFNSNLKYDVLFNCLGTTRSGGHSPSGSQDIGGADNFYNVEVGMTKVISELAVKAGIKFASVVTAEGANSNFMKGYDWIRYIHPLFYMRTLGEKEEVMINAGFQKVSIFRPGLLNRQVDGGIFQSMCDALNVGLKVSTLAKAQIRDAQTKSDVRDVKTDDVTVVFYESNPYIAQASKL